MFQAYVCDSITGAVLDRVAVSSFSWERLLSARGSGSVTIPLDGTYTRAQLTNLTQPWSRIFALAYNDKLLFMGYVTSGGYDYGGDLKLGLTDLWGLFGRRGAWDHGAPHVEVWKATVTGSLAYHADRAILRGRTGPALPAMGFPLTLPGGYAGSSVTRTYYGYHIETVEDVLSKLLDEGLDIYLRPRFISNGETDWLFQAGPSWGSGVTHEFSVTSGMSEISKFSQTTDASRVTNNARYIGEGSEVDMLVRSSRNASSPYPLLDRSTPAKTVSNEAQLWAMADADLALYASPTVQWDFNIHISHGIDVGDTVRLHFDGDPVIADGWHTRKVVKVSGCINEFVTVGVQATGGA